MSLSNFVKRVRNIMRNDAGINGDAQRIEQIAWMLFLKVYDEKDKDREMDEDDYTSIIPEQCRWQNWAKDDGSGNALTLYFLHSRSCLLTIRHPSRKLLCAQPLIMPTNI